MEGNLGEYYFQVTQIPLKELDLKTNYLAISSDNPVNVRMPIISLLRLGLNLASDDRLPYSVKFAS